MAFQVLTVGYEGTTSRRYLRFSADVNIYNVVFGVVTLYTLKMRAEFSPESPVPMYQAK